MLRIQNRVGHSPCLPLVSVNVRTVTETLKKIPFTTWLSGFIILLIYEAIDAGLNDVLELLFKSPSGTPNWVWFIAGLSVSINIIFPIGIIYWLLSGLKTKRSREGDLQQLQIETLRVWGKILLYSLAALIPGIWKWLSSIFVPYVVLFSKKYQQGEVDAIKASTQAFKKVWGRALLVLFIFSILIPLLMTTSFDEYREIWVHPIGATLLGLAEYFCLVFSLFLLLNLYLKATSNLASHEVNDELVF